MPYQITPSDPSKAAILVADQQFNVSTCSLSLVGKFTPSYGQAVANDLYHLLENFAGPIAPGTSSLQNPLSPVFLQAPPVPGQLWYDDTNSLLKLCQNDLSWLAMATQDWTTSWVGQQGFVTQSALNGQGFVTSTNVTPGTYTKVVVNHSGSVTAGMSLTVLDLPYAYRPVGSINGILPDTQGNINITVSGGGSGLSFYNSTLTGSTSIQNLTVSNGNSNTDIFVTAQNGMSAMIDFQKGSLERWQEGVDNTVETGSNTGSNFVINSFNDDGSLLATPFTINRGSGVASFLVTPTAPTAITTDNSTKLATTAFVAEHAGSAAPLMNAIVAPGSSTLFSRQDHVHPVDTSRQASFGFTPVQQGTGIGQLGDVVKIGWSSVGLKATVNATDLGRIWTNNATTVSSNANGWYIVFPNGFIIQGGCLSVGSGWSNQFFPIAFPTFCCSIQINEGGVNWGGWGGGLNPTIHGSASQGRLYFLRGSSGWNGSSWNLGNFTYSWTAFGW